MFSIKYLYSIRNNFAIIYSGSNDSIKKTLLEKFKIIKKNYKDLYINCSSHLNKFGNQVLAEIFEKKIKDKNLQ